MFIEPHITGGKAGWIEMISGCMFSGKTEELIRRLKRVQIAGRKAAIFKPAIDVRYDETDIVSHDTTRITSIPVIDSSLILARAQGMDVVGIDEVQFFDEGIVDVADQLAVKGIRVIGAGLDMDYTGKPFGSMPALLAKAEYVTKLHAICVKCGEIASYSHRKSKIEGQLFLGEQSVYEPRCRACFYS